MSTGSIFFFPGWNMQRWYTLDLNLIDLVLMMMMNTVRSHVADTSFDIVEPGQKIFGKVGAERPARRNIECSSM